MYWPSGAPRVFAAPKKRRPPSEEEDEKGQLEEEKVERDTTLCGLRVSRSGQLFATITSTTLDIWQSSPVALITCVERSKTSLSNYGHNVAVLLRPDSSLAAVQTSFGYIVTYDITLDPTSRVYQQIRFDEKSKRSSIAGKLSVEEGRLGLREVHIRFRMVIKIDAGIGSALALEDELVVGTERPAAVQCIRWVPDNANSQTSTELLSRLPWITKKSAVVGVIYDRAMSLFIWIGSDGRAYAVQRIVHESQRTEGQGKIFRGHGFHTPNDKVTFAKKAAINARFSLLAIGCANGEVHVYAARDYVGSLPLSHKLQPPGSLSTTGAINFMGYSPDGYCLFVGYEHGWVMWSVYGKLGGHSFMSEQTLSQENDDHWLMGVQDGSWVMSGSEILLIAPNDDRVWVLEIAKSAITGCFGPANTSRTLLHTASRLMIYRGHDSKDNMPLPMEDSLWAQVQIPASFLANQSPIRCAVTSLDGRYLAVAGRRGLAHYSMQSGRWKTFDNPNDENEFVVRGGMCWHQHILVVAVDTGDHDEIRLYSRELGLSGSSIVCSKKLPSPAVTITPSGDDSLLVYTYENNLYHYVINTSKSSIELIRVGQIGLHGIVRAPARVRAVTWYVPNHQLLDGDPSQDVIHASVLFLVDAKLVLLQPAKDESGALKYDMRIVANDVEYFSFVRDQVPLRNNLTLPQSPSESDLELNGRSSTALDLLDSLWYFDGQCIQCWPDIQDLLKVAALQDNKDLPQPVAIPVDFYPTSIILNKGVVLGLEPDLIQRRDIQFAYCRFSLRTQLFIPPILHHFLAASDSSCALSLCHYYHDLSYFPHALEVLLHTVLDEEVDTPPSKGQALLPSVLSFLSSFPDYLDILVQCTRKTEVRSWKTLFATLPPPRELFEESLQKGFLKTAGSYLLVLHTLEPEKSSSEQCIRLLREASRAQDWELCKELARFLMALDESGETLREAMRQIGMEVPRPPSSHLNGNKTPDLSQLRISNKLRIPPRKPTGSGDNTSPTLRTRLEKKSPAVESSASEATTQDSLSDDEHSLVQGS